MPGTIHVSVVEFKSSSSSPTSLKVSMGKRGYETWDKGDFSFPLTTLRDNLIVTLQDADGNEIAWTGVGTMLIVEKGSWDDYFALEGGGEVHMKLHFVLSEEERERIRIMRESALRKKQKKEFTDLAESSFIDFEQKIIDRREDSHGTEVQRESVEVLKTIQEHPKVGLGPSSDQEASSKLGLLGSEFKFKTRNISTKLNDDSLHKSEVHGTIKKTPSAVWKMISAFESNLSQEPRSPVKSPNLKSQSNQVGKGDFLKEKNSKDETKPAESNSEFLPSSLFERKQTSSFISRQAADISSDQAGENLIAQKAKLTDPEIDDAGSRRVSDPLEEDDIYIKRVVGETSEVSNSTELVKLSLDLTRNSGRTFSGKIHEECNSFGNLVMETFPNNTRRLCITTAGKEVMSSFETQEPEDRGFPELENPGPEGTGEGVTSQGDHPKIKDHRAYGKQRNSRPESSPDSPGGLVGQAIKIAIIAGFGILVLLTRQREPRKRKTDANYGFNDPSGFLDE